MGNLDQQLNSYNYHLPPELMADRPAYCRDRSRLMVYHQSSGEIEHTLFHQLPQFLNEENLLVFNQSKVIPARMAAVKESGGVAEIFITSLRSTPSGSYQCLINCSGKKKMGDRFRVGTVWAQIMGITAKQGTFEVIFDSENIVDLIDEYGEMPIPPYIRGGVGDRVDKSTYQTIYAKDLGAVAAPTAGLHFTQELLNNLKASGIEQSFLTLHVGMGTFAPVRSKSILEHQMHSEEYFVDEENLKLINQRGKKLIAVGTTSLRALESGLDTIPNKVCSTDIFLYPGKKIKSINGLITNFHLPKSSLLMLVSALIGREKTLELYEIAIKEKYRFYSYGDAMLILQGRS